MARHVVAPASEIAPGTCKIVSVAGREIGIFNVNDEFFALINRCPHEGAPLCIGPIPGRFTAAAARLVGLWRRAADPADTALADRVVDAWIGARAYRLHTLATVGRLAAGGAIGASASLGKVFWSELDVGLQETALDLLGPGAEVRDREGPDGRWLHDYLFSLAGPIYAGTNEIQRNVIAQRLLGLPR